MSVRQRQSLSLPDRQISVLGRHICDRQTFLSPSLCQTHRHRQTDIPPFLSGCLSDRERSVWQRERLLSVAHRSVCLTVTERLFVCFFLSFSLPRSQRQIFVLSGQTVFLLICLFILFCLTRPLLDPWSSRIRAVGEHFLYLTSSSVCFCKKSFEYR